MKQKRYRFELECSSAQFLALIKYAEDYLNITVDLQSVEDV